MTGVKPHSFYRRHHSGNHQQGAALDAPARWPTAGTGVLRCHYGWYNTERIQKDLGWLSPDEHETAWHARQASQAKPATLQPVPTGDRF
jgi:hypothetical protein